jgi:mono/diheme cytochrome c family protein
VTSRQADKRCLRLLLLAFSLNILLGRDAAAQSTKAKSAKAKSPPCADSVTTKSGVYTAAQATRGRDVYAGNCKSCHTPESHTGATFNATWNKRSLSELYTYIRDRMPKNEPGSLSAEEYADVLAYVLKLNRMPAGQRELPADSAAIKRIRIDVLKSR